MVREPGRQPGRVLGRDSAAALAILLDGIPEEQQGEVRAALVERHVFYYRQAKTELPRWLEQLRAPEPPPADPNTG